ncbi:hypothetical protein [Arthrobacter sp. ISL-65]|uniref:hypothetical protein n=1 Tax=Arthrobacter sp. ISL-65 TaxID=2819112 RepID=UPI001BE848E8|nr:hypothetical protein [Arthrobacter sp. ISL-65]MBT2550567.1 hypothetical protein [Arthrobacter sp. ISL-65]
MAPIDITNPTDSRLREAVTEILNAHDLAVVMTHGAPDSEYDPEMKDLVTLIKGGTAITPDVVAGVWHKWFGDGADEPERPTSAMTALADDLLAALQARGT